MTQDRAVLGPETMKDDSGNTFDEELRQALATVESHTQAYMAGHEGEWPEKGYEIRAKIEVAPKGTYLRAVTWSIDVVKYPPTSVEHTQFARSEGGVIVTDRPGGQQRLPLRTSVEELTQLEDDPDGQ